MTNSKFTGVADALAINLPLYALSVACVHAMGHKIDLYADTLGAEILSPVPYDTVHIIDNTITDNWHFAASIKFCALQQMPLGTVLIDGDIILHRPEVYRVIDESKEDITVSFFEPKDYIKNNVNPEIFRKLRQQGFEYPYKTPDYTAIEGWLNTSLMKFTSEKLKQEYIDQYIKHLKLLEKVDFNGMWPDIAIEQYHLSCLVREGGYTVNRVIKNYPSAEAEHYAGHVGFAHVGAMKRNMTTIVRNMLERVDSALYYDILNHIDVMTAKLSNVNQC